ncbi:MAG: ThuA domain-containing protein [Planctomycetaceae bacterium]|jgi:type 1 glutamine amidotransferase|nr:ThuA domain-containing protein [Planctomycetaceae bacterium]
MSKLQPKLFSAAACLLLFAFAAVPNELRADDGKTVVTLLLCAEGDETAHYDAYNRMPAFMERLAKDNNWDLHIVKSLKYADFPSLEILDKTDVLVVYVRRIALPKAEMERLQKYVKESGKGLVALRTASHGFAAGKIPETCQAWKEFDKEVLGGNYHGHGANEIGSEIWNVKEQAKSPVLKDVKPDVWHCDASVYFNDPAAKDAVVYQYAASSEKGRMPLTWTRSYGSTRVAYTALGYKTDYDLPQFQALIRNLVNWTGEKR